jgi:hypothetical protein
MRDVPLKEGRLARLIDRDFELPSQSRLTASTALGPQRRVRAAGSIRMCQHSEQDPQRARRLRPVGVTGAACALRDERHSPSGFPASGRRELKASVNASLAHRRAMRVSGSRRADPRADIWWTPTGRLVATYASVTLAIEGTVTDDSCAPTGSVITVHATTSSKQLAQRRRAPSSLGIRPVMVTGMGRLGLAADSARLFPAGASFPQGACTETKLLPSPLNGQLDDL